MLDQQNRIMGVGWKVKSLAHFYRTQISKSATMVVVMPYTYISITGHIAAGILFYCDYFAEIDFFAMRMMLAFMKTCLIH